MTWFWELFDKFALLLTFFMIAYLFISDPRAFIREWILIPFFGKTMPDRGADHDDADDADDAADDDQGAHGDAVMIEAAARMLAADLAGEAAIIETLFDVRRGGGARYTALRDRVRVAARARGWSAARNTPTLRITRSGKSYEIPRDGEEAV